VACYGSIPSMWVGDRFDILAMTANRAVIAKFEKQIEAISSFLTCFRLLRRFPPRNDMRDGFFGY